MAHQATPSSQKALMMELKSLQEQPVEGFRITLVEESDLYNWEVAIFGPPNTLYEGGYFKVGKKHCIVTNDKISNTLFYVTRHMFFSFQNGDVCISILHPPVDDPQSGELPSERWNPTQNVRTILLSVISLLNEPNTFSPANVDASVMFRKWRDSKGKDKEYAEIIRKQVLSTAAEAERDGVKVPTTLAEYCVQTRVPSQDSSSDLLYDDLYDDDMEEEEEEEDESEMESVGEAGGFSTVEDSGTSTRCYDNQDDSGNEDS
ncbi:Ubiquitin-conjugating enzyme E2 R2 [Channa argus]|uniref:Ubiquitin-conjugating enzyme E2 R2 n=1 Tax=Channa argus TaxID=215402 RepID=A0A6G1PHW9_CHAAH|nr:Ubiquitin-conjugating enzyme E2 R2 [Channa argus]